MLRKNRKLKNTDSGAVQHSNCTDEAYSERLLAVHEFHQKAQSQMFDKILNASMHVLSSGQDELAHRTRRTNILPLIV